MYFNNTVFEGAAGFGENDEPLDVGDTVSPGEENPPPPPVPPTADFPSASGPVDSSGAPPLQPFPGQPMPVQPPPGSPDGSGPLAASVGAAWLGSALVDALCGAFVGYVAAPRPEDRAKFAAIGGVSAGVGGSLGMGLAAWWMIKQR